MLLMKIKTKYVRYIIIISYLQDVKLLYRLLTEKFILIYFRIKLRKQWKISFNILKMDIMME